MKSGGMEINSPFSKARMTVDEACKLKTFCLVKITDGTVRLKKTMTIIFTGELYSSNLNLLEIIFIVYFGKDRPFFIENIPFDSNCWLVIFQK